MDRSLRFEAGWIAAALLAGWALFAWPVLPVAAAVLGGGLVLAIVVQPLFGLGLALLAGPFVAVERLMWNLPLDSGQALLLLTLAAWGLRGLARRKLHIPSAPLTIPLLIFLGAAAFSLCDAFSAGAGLRELFKWVEVIAVYLMLVDLLDDRNLPWVIGMVLLAASVQAAIGVWQFGLRGQGPEHFLIPGTAFYRAYGSFEQPNPFAGYLGLNLPLVAGLLTAAVRVQGIGCKLRVAGYRSQVVDCRLQISRSWLVLLLCAALLSAGLLASWSRGAWLGAAAGLGSVLAFWPRRWWLGLGLALVVMLAVGGGGALGLLPQAVNARLAGITQYMQIQDVRGVGVNDANYAVVERLAHWQAAIEMIRWHPWTGVGLGNYEVAYEKYRLLNWPYALGHAHNIFLNLTAETGLLGLAAYVFLWAAILGHTLHVWGRTSGWQRGLALGCLGVWVYLHVHMMFDHLYVSNVWIHLAVLLGVLTRLDRQEKSERE